MSEQIGAVSLTTSPLPPFLLRPFLLRPPPIYFAPPAPRLLRADDYCHVWLQVWGAFFVPTVGLATFLAQSGHAGHHGHHTSLGSALVYLGAPCNVYTVCNVPWLGARLICNVRNVCSGHRPLIRHANSQAPHGPLATSSSTWARWAPRRCGSGCAYSSRSRSGGGVWAPPTTSCARSSTATTRVATVSSTLRR